MRDAGLVVRAAVPGDEMAVARVHVRSWQAGYRGLLPQAYLDELRSEDRAAQYTFGSVDSSAPTTIVAKRDGIIEGFASYGAAVEPDVPNAGALLALYVDPGAWRRGIGRTLAKRVHAELGARGYSEAVLWLLAGNETGRLFYERESWIREEREKTEQIWGVTVDSVRYRRAIP